MDKVMHNSPETKAIRQRMEEVRCDLDEDVQEIVEGARVMGDWRHYVRTYPWICLGAALAAGYWIVPHRTPGMEADAQTHAESADPGRLHGTSLWTQKSNVRGRLLALVGNLVMRRVSAYVGQQFDKLFATQAARPPQDDQP